MKYPVFGIIHIILLAAAITACIVFHMRRKLHPIPGRYPRSSLLNAVLNMLTLLGQVTFSLNDSDGDDIDQSPLPCWMAVLPYSWTMSMAFMCVVLRAFMLLGQFEIAAHVRAVATNAIPVNSLTLSWFVRHRQWVKPMALFKASVALGGMQFALIFGIAMAVFPSGLTAACSTMPYTASILPNVTALLPATNVMVGCVILAIIAQRLSKHNGSDAFGIGTELRTIGKCMASLVICVIPILLFPAKFFGLTLITLSALAIFVPTIVLPIVLSYQFQALQRQQADDLQRVTKVEELLSLPQGFEIFSQYCQTEFNAEGITFWARVNAYRASCHPVGASATADHYQSVINDAYSIVNTFIIQGAPLEVNISSKLRHTIYESLMAQLPQAQSWIVTNIGTPAATVVASSPPTAIPLPPPSSSATVVPITNHGPTSNGRGASSRNSGAAYAIGSPYQKLSTYDTTGSSTNTHSSIPMMGSKASVGGVSFHLTERAGTPSRGMTPDIDEKALAVALSPFRQLSKIFDEAQSVCIALLQAGPFRRFTTSQVFKSFIDGLQHGNSSKEAMDQAVSRIHRGGSGAIDKDDDDESDAMVSSIMHSQMAMQPMSGARQRVSPVPTVPPLSSSSSLMMASHGTPQAVLSTNNNNGNGTVTATRTGGLRHSHRAASPSLPIPLSSTPTPTIDTTVTTTGHSMTRRYSGTGSDRLAMVQASLIAATRLPSLSNTPSTVVTAVAAAHRAGATAAAGGLHHHHSIHHITPVGDEHNGHTHGDEQSTLLPGSTE